MRKIKYLSENINVWSIYQNYEWRSFSLPVGFIILTEISKFEIVWFFQFPILKNIFQICFHQKSFQNQSV